VALFGYHGEERLSVIFLVEILFKIFKLEFNKSDKDYFEGL